MNTIHRVSPNINNRRCLFGVPLRTCGLSCLAIVAVLSGLVACALSAVATVRAQTPACPGPGSIVRVIPTAVNNLRPKAGGPTVADNAATKTLHFEDGEFVVLEGPERFNGDDWLRVSGGWMWVHNLTITCPTPGPSVTPSATPTRTPTSTPRPTGTSAPVVTPTRLAVQLLYCHSTPVVVQVEPGLWRVECDYR